MTRKYANNDGNASKRTSSTWSTSTASPENLYTLQINKDSAAEDIDRLISQYAKRYSNNSCKTFKALYIEQLTRLVNNDDLTSEQCKNLALHLLNNSDKHPLAQERHYFKGSFFSRSHAFSEQTQSMHSAIRLLLKAPTLEIKKTWFGHKYAIEQKATDNQSAKSFSLYRHASKP